MYLIRQNCMSKCKIVFARSGEPGEIMMMMIIIAVLVSVDAISMRPDEIRW